MQHWNEGTYQIDVHPDGFVLHRLGLGDEPTVVALCKNGKALSNWAMSKGAPSVKWPGGAWEKSERNNE